ncbi:MAG: hypothetical protein IJ794_09490 [Lachnospiraceae bacterium]|nr:hypothetical protein [Lachnospiraceae bacterium]
MEEIIQETDPAVESDYQRKLEAAREEERNGELNRAEAGYRELVVDYPEKFGAWWAYARFYMERLLEQEPCPPYREMELESVMLTKALNTADHSQQLFIKQRIAEYKAAWAVKCEESRRKTQEALREYPDFGSFVKEFHGTFESTHDSSEDYYKLLRHGKKELYFEKVSPREHHRAELIKYTYSNWNDHDYRLTGLYDETADFDLYVKEYDGQRIVLVYVYTEDKVRKHRVIELVEKSH